MATVREQYGQHPIVAGTEFMCGVEYEIECIKTLMTDKGLSKWAYNVHEDPSLRNNGHEIVSPPLSFDDQLKFFDDLHKSILFNSGDPFSDRTSTHVHVNFQNISWNKVMQFINLYVLFEPYFFSLVNEERVHSIYCVPLNHTFLPRYYDKSPPYLVGKWHKYTAFNILPLASFGTIEFRHLQGTNDPVLFKKWLSTIKRLYDFNLENEIKWSAVLDDLDTFKRFVFPDCVLPTAQLIDTALDVKLATGSYPVSALINKIAKIDSRVAAKKTKEAEVPF